MVHARQSLCASDENWFSKEFRNKDDKLYRIEYHRDYGGNGEKIEFYYSNNGLLDYEVYNGYDTIFYQYNNKDQLIREENKKYFYNYKYDSKGNRIRSFGMRAFSDTLDTKWEYDYEYFK